MSQESTKRVVGLTGGIASGKSSALGYFQALGWSVLSADTLAGQILASDQSVQDEIKQRWGNDLINSCGSVDKAAIAAVVFEKESERLWIGELLHPIIRSKWISFVQSCPSPKCMIELPLLFENNLQNHFTCTISTFAPIPTMLKRLQSRGLSKDDSVLRINSQLTNFQKIDLADYVLWGGGSKEFLNNQVREIHSILS